MPEMRDIRPQVTEEIVNTFANALHDIMKVASNAMAKASAIAEIPATNPETGGIELDSRFWDCECDTQFIHRRALHLICEECGKYECDGADSRVKELETPKALCPCVYDRGFDVDVEPAIRNSNAEVNNAA